jgi:peptidoglycan/xylan/chitin deacetylase (PgdA/CDA1 family)
MWNAMTSDWKDPSANAIASRLTRAIDNLARQGRAANIVLHDGSHQTPAANRAPSIAAAARLITHYKRTGQFVTLNAWS